MIRRRGSIFSATTYSKLKSAYDQCIKTMFGYTRRDSLTGVFLDLSLPTLDIVVHNSRVLFANQCIKSCKKIVKQLLCVCIHAATSPSIAFPFLPLLPSFFFLYLINFVHSFSFRGPTPSTL